MAQTFVNNSGMIIKMYSQKEQDATWNELEAFDKMVASPNHIKYTNDRNELPYQILKEVKPTYDTYIKTIKANNKIVVVKCNWKNENDKTNKAVAKLFGK